jgi:hypothetical protein
VADFVEAAFDVGIKHPHQAPVGRLADDLYSLMGGPLRAKPETGGQKVGFEDRLEHDLRRRHDHPVRHRGYRQRSRRFTRRVPRLGDVHPPQRLGPIRSRLQLCGEIIEEGPHSGHPVGLDRLDTHAVDAGGAVVGGHVHPRLP